MRIEFPGPAWNFDHDLVCQDCGRTLHFEGTAWVDPDEIVATHLSIHRCEDCPAWRNRLWRASHHHGPWYWRWRHRTRKTMKALADDDN